MIKNVAPKTAYVTQYHSSIHKCQLQMKKITITHKPTESIEQ